MTEPIVDTSILIDYMRGHAQAIAWLDATRIASGLFTHAIAAAELLKGARDQPEQRQIDRFLARFTVLPANEAIRWYRSITCDGSGCRTRWESWIASWPRRACGWRRRSRRSTASTSSPSQD